MAIRRTGSQTLVNRGVTAAAATPVNIITGSGGGGGATVNISSIQIANSTFVAKDDTAIDTAGGFMIINGTGFQSGAAVYIQGTAATSTAFVSSSRLNVTVPALSSGLLDVYVVNTDGSGSIFLRSLNANGTPSWTTTSPLTTQDIDTAFAINLVASGAAGDGTITYAVSAGSTLPSGTFLASNGYFYGTVSGIETETTYSFSIDAIDAQNQETARSFNITVRSGDLNFKDTVLLLNGETINNTWITDASSNSFAITVSGDTRASAFSPYETVWSNFFDGTGDYLSAGTTQLWTPANSFTIEGWFYLPSLSSASGIYSKDAGTSGSSRGIFIYVNTSGAISVFYSTTGSSEAESTSSNGVVAAGRWHHFAFVKNGSDCRLYLNGSSVISFTASSIACPASPNNNIGVNGSSNLFYYMNGYISNLRIFSNTAVYTSTFTPPTSPLTAIANTSLLTCQSNRLIDNSTNNFTITRNGDVSISNFGPFVETDITTGSGYFDGTTDYLTVPNNAGIQFGTGVFTIEFWMHRASSATAGALLSMTGAAYGNWAIIMTGGVMYFQDYYATNSLNNNFNITTAGITPFTWAHVAYVRTAGGSSRFYVNGVAVGTPVTDNRDYAGGGSLLVGGVASGGYGSFNGYISNLRIVKGVDVYTGRFTPPNRQLTIGGSSEIYANTSNVNTTFSSANTSLLTLQSRIGENNNRFIDTSGINNIITRNGNATQGTFSPYQRGGWSNYFDGNGDYLDPPNNVALYIGNLDGTIEFWINPNNVSGFIWSINDSAGDGSFWLQEKIGYNASTKSLYFETNVSQGSSTTYTLSSQSNSVPLNTWTHFAFVKINTTWNIYINGVLNATGVRSNLTTRVSGSTVRIGARGYIAIPEFFSGYISNLRVVKGTALYTSNFTPPTTRLTAVANTSLLTCADNAFIDQSPNNFTITRNGDVSIQPFSPFKVHTITPITHSVYFDGTGDYLTVPSNAAFNFGTGNFTVELWVYVTSFTGGATDVIASTYQNSTSGWTFGIFTDTSKFYFAIAGDSGRLDDTDSLLLNQWVHLMATRSGTTLSFYVNGSRKATATNSTNQTSTSNLFIGASVAATLNFFGYISNFRVVKGTAIYDPTQTTITVPTTLLTAITNTSLLTCASNTIVDLSTANTGNTAHAITVNGDARPTTVNPLGFTVSESTGPSTEYSITNDGGSIYLDGTGDYLGITDRADLRPGTSNFTLEAWIYRDVAGAAHTIYAKGGASTGIVLQVTSTNVLRFTHTTTNIDSTITIPAKSWTHVAVVREGTSTNQTKLYINGVFAAQGTVSTDFTQTEEARVGTNRAAGENFNGYISGLMFSRLARYTSAFVPLNSPRVDANNTLSINYTNGGIIDYTRKNNLETVGDVKLRNNIVKYGNTSMFFDGTGDYLKFASGYDTQFGSGDFTIEGWIRNNSIATTAALLERRASLTARGIALFFEGSTLKFNAGDTTTTAWEVTIVSGTLSSNTWYHFAFTRSGTTWRAFIDGTQVGSNVTWSGTIADETSNWFVGIAVDNTSAPLNAYIDDFRITKGVARYTSNFTAPTRQLQTN